MRYSGSFVSRGGIVWRVEIWQKAAQAFPAVGALTFEADEALVIEWQDQSKEVVICGSTATLRLDSPGDRTYEDLYTEEVGAIRADVYRDNKAYWSGCLDPEFYEEPYDRGKHYTVTLTFSDFGVLDRLKYDLAGMRTIREIVAYSLDRCQISTTTIDERLISTSLTPGGATMKLADVMVRSDNFYDEDGEASSLAEALAGILQPLSLRMIQRAGKVYIYDLHSLYTASAKQAIYWPGTGSVMGVDKIYNNAKITWNTYAQADNLLPDKCWTEPTDKNLRIFNDMAGAEYKGSIYHSIHGSEDLHDWIDDTDNCAFTVWKNRKGEGVTLVDPQAQFFKILPQYSGTEAEGVLVSMPYITAEINAQGNLSALLGGHIGTDVNYFNTEKTDITSWVLFRSKSASLPHVNDPGQMLVRVGIDLLLDPRYNFFEQPTALHPFEQDTDSKAESDTYDKWGNFLYVPVLIKFKPNGSDKVYSWTNTSIVTAAPTAPATAFPKTFGTWVEYTSGDGAPKEGEYGYLCWYDQKDRAEKSGVLDWKKNRTAINPHSKKINAILENAAPGQYIPFPNFGKYGGTIQIEVLRRFKWWDAAAKKWHDKYNWLLHNDGDTDFYKTIIYTNAHRTGYWNYTFRDWVLMRLPELEIMNNAQFDTTINTDDVEYSAEINGAAKEGIELDTICGTSAEGVPTSRGAYFDAATGDQITQLTRAGRTATAEELLIGTLYSQYARRKTTLSGEVRLLADGVVKYTEENQAGKVFLLAGDVQDVIADTSRATYIELRPDEYEKKIN